MPLGQVVYRAEGKLDYGNAPRATPLVVGLRAYLFGAFGHAACVNLETMETVWQRNLAAEYHTPELPWGLTGSPVMAGDILVVQPGGLAADVVGLNPETGETVWTSEAGKPGHSSGVVTTVAGRTQLIGYDATSLVGWDATSGERLWSIVPPLLGDFNVPTPIIHDNRVLVTTENNGARLYQFDENGILNPTPVAANGNVNPDSHTPVLSRDRVYGVVGGLHCLDAQTLEPRWLLDDSAFYAYTSLVASGAKLLAFTSACELILIDDNGDAGRIVDRLKLVDDGAKSYSHPALAGTRLYVRLGRNLICLDLADAPSSAADR
ncbi:MAG: PQQ-binding-like beta-propeller repeat protein [Planctomycetaceae bacterium]